MKRKTAERHVNEVVRRLRAVNGLIGTPTASRQFCKIRRLWLFGSVLKGKDTPGDVDILAEFMPCGRIQRASNAYLRGKPWQNARFENPRKRYLMASPIDDAIRYLTKGMKMVRVHCLDVDGDIANPRVLLWPIDHRGDESQS